VQENPLELEKVLGLRGKEPGFQKKFENEVGRKLSFRSSGAQFQLSPIAKTEAKSMEVSAHGIIERPAAPKKGQGHKKKNCGHFKQQDIRGGGICYRQGERLFQPNGRY